MLNKTKIRRENGVYTIVNVGMGCCIYLTYNFSYKSFMGYFMHWDCYGQYGVNDLPKALDFVKNYKEVWFLELIIYFEVVLLFLYYDFLFHHLFNL